jgi:hypothetical protein
MGEEKQTTPPKQITPQKAVVSAVTYLVGVLGEIEKPQQFSVEKVSISKDKKIWTVVLGYERQGTEPNSLSVLLGNNPRRYKTIELDAETGEGISLSTFNPDKN